MRINLRKAMRLRKEVEAALSDFQVPTEVRIDADAVEGPQDFEAAVDAARAEMVARVELHGRLSAVLGEIRKAINVANASSGVDAALADGAAIDREIRIQQRIAGAARAEGTQVLHARASRLRASLKAPDQGYGRGPASPVVTAQLVTEAAAVASAKRVQELKREREAVEDRRLALNAGTEIEIGEEGAAVLRAAGLV